MEIINKVEGYLNLVMVKFKLEIIIKVEDLVMVKFKLDIIINKVDVFMLHLRIIQFAIEILFSSA